MRLVPVLDNQHTLRAGRVEKERRGPALNSAFSFGLIGRKAQKMGSACITPACCVREVHSSKGNGLRTGCAIGHSLRHRTRLLGVSGLIVVLKRHEQDAFLSMGLDIMIPLFA